MTQYDKFLYVQQIFLNTAKQNEIYFLPQIKIAIHYFQEDWTNEDRTEDEIIAWTWYKFIETYQQNVTDPNYLALFPMVKVRIKGVFFNLVTKVDVTYLGPAHNYFDSLHPSYPVICKVGNIGIFVFL